jgi:IS66 Orf2 like protein
MIGPSGAVRVMVATKPVDFRKGAEGLAALVREIMQVDPFDGAGLSGILCAGPVEPSRLNEPFVEHDGELGLCLEPLARGHLPLSGGVAQDEKQQLHRGFVGRKMASRAHGAA